MSIPRKYHCTVTDGLDTIWVLGGCDPDECWERGFIEQYTISTNTWEQLTATPNMDKAYDWVNVCAFWEGFIFASFYKSDDSSWLAEGKFHIFDTSERKWKISSTRLNTEVSWVISALVP